MGEKKNYKTTAGKIVIPAGCYIDIQRVSFNFWVLSGTYANPYKLSFTNTTVSASAFVSSTTYTDFPYRAAVALSGVTAAMVPEVVFSAANAMSGIFAPVSESYNGGVYIYAAEKPSGTITIPTIICWR